MQQGVWTTSSRCTEGGGDCVEVLRIDGTTYVRDSKRNGSDEQSVLAFEPAEWSAFVAGVRDGEFDLT